MKKTVFLLIAFSLMFSLVSCSPVEPYEGNPIAPASASDVEPWPADTFFASAPHVSSSVKSVTINEDKTTYSIKISEISYENFVKWANAMKEAGVTPTGSGEYGLDGTPVDGLASFNGETRKYTVISTWTNDTSSDCALSLSFIKK